MEENKTAWEYPEELFVALFEAKGLYGNKVRSVIKAYACSP
jgi:hypothetical protein